MATLTGHERETLVRALIKLEIATELLSDVVNGQYVGEQARILGLDGDVLDQACRMLRDRTKSIRMEMTG